LLTSCGSAPPRCRRCPPRTTPQPRRPQRERAFAAVLIHFIFISLRKIINREGSQLLAALLQPLRSAPNGGVVRRQEALVEAQRAAEVRQRAAAVAAQLRCDANVEHRVCAVPVVRALAHARQVM
jgi:hypothetical protein